MSFLSDDEQFTHEWIGRVNVESRTGHGSRGKYTLYLLRGVHNGKAVEFSTFDKSVADEAIKAGRNPVRICWEDDAGYRRVFSLETSW